MIKKMILSLLCLAVVGATLYGMDKKNIKSIKEMQEEHQRMREKNPSPYGIPMRKGRIDNADGKPTETTNQQPIVVGEKK